jgi:hypothetical protein
MMKKTLFSCFLMYTLLCDAQVSVIWAVDTLPRFVPIDAVIDLEGSIIVVGSFSDTFPGSGFEILITKISNTGAVGWLTLINDNVIAVPNALSVDHLGNIYASGVTGVDYDIGLTTKLNANGDLEWLINTEKNNLDNALLSDQELLITEGTGGDDFTTVQGDGLIIDSCSQPTILSKASRFILVESADELYVAGTGTIDDEYIFFVERIDTGCNLVWQSAIQADTSSLPLGSINKFYLDSYSNSYLAGIAYLDGDNHFFSCKFDASGNLIWKSYYRENFNYASDVVVDISGNAYVTGYNFDGDSSQCLTICYDAEGNQKWLNKTSGDSFVFYEPQIEIDQEGYLYILSEIDQEVPKINWSLRKLDNEGNEIWSTIYPGRPHLLLLDSLNSIYVCGQDSDQTNSVIVKYAQFTSIDEMSTVNNLSVFPNPFTSEATIQFSNSSNYKPDRLELYDLAGKLLRREDVSGQSSYHLRRQGLPAGMYHLHLKDEERLLDTAKIIIQ